MLMSRIKNILTLLATSLALSGLVITIYCWSSSAGIDLVATEVEALAVSSFKVANTTQPPSPSHTVEKLGRLPLHFEANQGQIDHRVKFLARGVGYNLFLTPDEMVLTLVRQGTEQKIIEAKSSQSFKEPNHIIKSATESVLRVQLVGGNRKPKITGLEKQAGQINYYLGNDKRKWQAGIPTYSKVQYSNVYPGVDLIYYGNQQHLEYDFIVAPRADPNSIRLRFTGIRQMCRTERGDLLLDTPAGEIRHHRPVIYQEVNGQRRTVEGRFVQISENEVAFTVGAYDVTLPLVIDPVLVYSTYLGGVLFDQGQGIAVDASGIYIAGSTTSPTFPGAGNSIGSGGLYKTTNAAGNWSLNINGLPIDDIRALAVDPTNANIVYATTYGFTVFKSTDGGANWAETGAGPSSASFIAIAPSNPNTIYASTFYATSAGFAGVYHSTNGGTSWTFSSHSSVANFASSQIVIDPTDSNTVYVGTDGGGVVKTTNGGTSWVLVNAGLSDLRITSMTIDPINSSVLYASASGGVFKTTNGGTNWTVTGAGPRSGSLAIDPSAPDTVYVASGNLWKTTNGGTTWAIATFTVYPNQIIIDPATPTTLYACASVDGMFKSIDGGVTFAPANIGITSRAPVSALALSPANPSIVYVGFTRTSDIFVTKLSPAGNTLIYSSYLGGSASDISFGSLGNDCLAIDASGNAYVVGTSWSQDFPTLNAFQGVSNGADDLTLTKLGVTGALAYSTYLGGNANEQAYGGVAVDISSNVYVAGWTGSSNFPTRNAYQATSAGSNEAFVAKFNPALSGNASLLYSTYLGGTNADWAYGVDADAIGNVYLAGYTFSTNFPVLNAYQSAYNGANDAFFTKLNTNLSGAASLIYSTYLGGSGNDIAYGVAIDTTGMVQLTGNTSSTNFPTRNAFQSTFGGASDAFMTTINPNLSGNSSLIYSTYLGGSGTDNGYSIAVNGAGQAYVTGSTVSNNFPSVAPMQIGLGGAFVFAAKLTPYLAGVHSVSYATRIGGGTGYAIALDSTNAAYVTGSAGNFPLVNPFQATITPLGDINFGDSFIAKIADGFPYTVTPLFQFFTTNGGSANINVAVAGNQPAWTVTNLPSWLTAAPMSGTGTGTVTLTAQSFTDPTTRAANIVVAGQVVNIFQSGGGCNTYSITPNSQNFPIAGGTGSISVTTPGGCFWPALSAVPWISIMSGLNGNGNGIVNFTVAANTGPARSGTVHVANQAFIVTQNSACTAAINIGPASAANGFAGTTYSQTFTQTGGTGGIVWSVSAGALPGGLSLNPLTGVLSGTPTSAGIFNFSIRARDQNGCIGDRTYTVNVTPQQFAPFISSIVPSNPVASGNNQNVSVFGGNFQVGMTVRITFPDGNGTTLSGTQIQNVTSSSFVMTATLNASGSWSIRVDNPNGGQSNTYSITVQPPSGITISSISPSIPIRSSADQPITVNGSNFQPGLTVTVTFPSGSGTTLSGAQIQNVTSNSFVMLATLNATGIWYIRVNNPGGAQSNSFSFSVQSGPAISHILPVSPIMSSTDQPVTVRGINFQPGLTVSVTFPNGQSATLSGAQIQNVSSASFVMLITLNATGNWTIRINVNGIQSNAYSFIVRAPAPTITSITPTPVIANQETPLTVTGVNFQNNFSAYVITPSGRLRVESTKLHFNSSNQIRVEVTMRGTPPYSASLEIVNPDGQSALEGFSVIGSPSSIKPLSGVVRIWDPQFSDLWKLNGDSVSEIRIWATPVGGGAPLYADDIIKIEAKYRFNDMPAGQYTLHAEVKYTDAISGNASFGWGCQGASHLRTAKLTTGVVNTSSVSSYDISFPPPIIMVHGITSCWEKWYCDDATCIGDKLERNNLPDKDVLYPKEDFWANYALDHGFIVMTPNYKWGLMTNWEERATQIKEQIEDNFRGLTKDINDANDNRFPPWFYVAHSMGGLVARVLVNGQHEISKLATSLKKIYILGTPNSGTDLRFYSGAGDLSESDLRGSFNQEVEKGGYPTFNGKPIAVYAGRGGSPDGSDDGEVPVNSVYKILRRYCWFNWVQARYECDDREILSFENNRLPDTGQKYRHSGLGSPTSREELLVQRILPDICYLSGRNCDAPPSMTAARSIALLEASAPKTNLRRVAMQSKSLSAAQADTLEFRISGTDLVKITVTASVGTASFSLRNPNGEAVDFATLPLSAGSRFINDLGESFTLYNPSAGLWSLHAVAGASGVSYAAVVLENSPLGFEGFTTSLVASVAQQIPLIGRWVGQTSNISSPSVTAQIINEFGTLLDAVNLFDDGAHLDGAAGDGIFGGDTPILSGPGRYTVNFIAQGIYHGQAFMRLAKTDIDVVFSTHLFTGAFSDIAVDSNADGTYDTLRAKIGISAPAAENYLVTADLLDAQGYYLDHAVGYIQANAAGMYSVNLNFRMSGATCGQYDAPFTIKNLTLSDAGTLKVLDIYADNVSTQTYDGSLFGCASGTPAPVVSSVQPNSMFPGTSGQVFINGVSFADGAQVSLGSGVTVSSVAYGGPGTLLAQVSVDAGAATGLRDVTITNPDGRSSTATGLFSVASDQAPTVTVANLTEQQNISGIVTVSASASDDRGVQRVEFYLDGVLGGSDTTFPYQFVWDTSTSSMGTHTLLARGYDTIGQTGSAQVAVNTNCGYSISPTDQAFAASGGTGVVNISTSAACGWIAKSNASWVVINSGAAGNGEGVVGFSIAANPSVARTGTISVAGKTFTVMQSGCTITIDPATISAGTMGAPYNQPLMQIGGAGAATFSVVGGELPNGVSLSPGGILSGTPTMSGSFNFTVRATDINNCFGERSYTLTINPCPPIAITPETLADGVAFATYSRQLSASGGASPYTFTVSDGALPAGVTLSSEGLLSGTPTATGPFTFKVRARDVNNCFGERQYALTITPNSGLQFYPLSRPIRLLDTRMTPSPNACNKPLAQIPGTTARTQPARGVCDGLTIPADAAAITGNITTVQSGGGFLTLYPSDVSRPTVANSNYGPNEILNNVFTVGLSASDGAFNIYVTTNTDVVVDVTGYYAPPGAGGLYFHPLPRPVRLLDTRANFAACYAPGAPLPGTTETTQQATGDCAGLTIPASAKAIIGNATTVNPQGTGYQFFTLFPADATRPIVASSNYQAGQIMNGPFTVGLSSAGAFRIYPTTQTELVIDVSGYYSPDATDVNGAGLLYYPLPRPVRLLETRPNFNGCYTTSAQLIADSTRTQPARGDCAGLTIPATAAGIIGNATVVQPLAGGWLTFWPSDATKPTVAQSNYATGQVFNRHFIVGLGSADGAFNIFTKATTHLVIDLSGYFAP